MKIKGFLKDLSGIFRVKKKRKLAIKNADDKEIKKSNINLIAKQLHPGKIEATVFDILPETNDSKRVVLSSKNIPYFLAGTYLVLTIRIGDKYYSRPYSIVSSPNTSYKEKIVEIIVKDRPNGLVSKYINHNLKVDDIVYIEVGQGQFSYNEFRDSEDIVAIAGGAGITPFISMAKDINERNLPINLTILYGSDNPDQIIGKAELDYLSGNNVRVIHVISGNYPYKGEKGFINSELIKKYSSPNCTYYFSGPLMMYRHIIEELKKLNVDLRRVRNEAFPIEDVSKEEGFDIKNINKSFNIEVHQGLETYHITCLGNQSIADALESKGINIHTSCRGGRCGSCRIKIIKGTYYIPSDKDERRFIDKEYHYVHSCVTYPTSDLVIKINIK